LPGDTPLTSPLLPADTGALYPYTYDTSPERCSEHDKTGHEEQHHHPCKDANEEQASRLLPGRNDWHFEDWSESPSY